MTPAAEPPRGHIRGWGVLRTAILVVIATLLLGEGFLLWAYRIVERNGDPMLIVGRRGDLGNWPENTLEGVASARDLGADGVEIDVRASADGTFFLMHDEDVARTTDGSGAIGSMTDDAVAALEIDGGLGYRGQDDLRVPSLTEVLDALSDYEGRILLDAKGDATEHAVLANLVVDLGLTDRVWICSYGVDETAAVRSAGAVTIYGSGGADLRMGASPFHPVRRF